MSARWRCTEFAYRGHNELARYSRLVYKQLGVGFWRLFVPLAAEKLVREEVLKLRGPTGPWGTIGWSEQDEAAYRAASRGESEAA